MYCTDTEKFNSGAVQDNGAALAFLASCEDASQFLTPSGKIDMVAILTRMEEMKKEKIIERHRYKINELPDGRWQTYIPDPDSKTGRKLVRRRSRIDLVDVIVEYLNGSETGKQDTSSSEQVPQQVPQPVITRPEPVPYVEPARSVCRKATLTEIAYKWLERKKSEPGFKDSSYDRYENQYKRLIGDYGKTEISTITDVDLEDFLMERIVDEQLTMRAWRDMKTVLRGIFKYAKRHKYTDIYITEVLELIDEEKRLFTRPKKKAACDEVFTDEEVRMVESYIDRRKRISLVDLGIKLAFKTGLRAGELAGLKYSDFRKESKCLSVSRTERHSKNEDGHTVYYFSEEGLLKSDHEAEDLYITNNAILILEQIHGLNPDSDFLFYTDHFIRAQAFTKRLNSICRLIGIKPRPLHKARKTYATRLINANVEDSLVMTQLRHSDITTTRKFYYFDNRTADEKSEAIERAIGQY